MRALRYVAVSVGLAALAAVGASAPSQATGGVTFTAPVRSDDPELQKTPTEPATIVDTAGRRYVANQLDSELAITVDGGRTWRYPAGDKVLAQNVEGCSVSPGGLIGDVELATDAGGRTYFSTLGVLDGGTADNGIQPLVAYSDDGYQTWHTKCAAHQPFMTDRQWLAVYSPPGTPSDQTRLYLTYHDFGPDQMWVNTSTDGGETWGLPVDVITSIGAVADSFCDTVPAGIAVDPKTGWIYVGWTAGPNPANNAGTGCNYTQGTIFNKFYVAVSKDGGATWNASLAMEGPDNTQAAPSDFSEIFGNVVTDRDGNVYVATPAYFGNEYGIYYAWSPPADASGALHFTAAYKVNAPDVHTAYYPRMVAGDAGRVELIYLGTPFKNVVSTPANKQTYNGGGDNEPNCQPELIAGEQHGARFPGKPCMLPDNTPWYLYFAQTLNGTAETPSFATQKLRADAVHYGDICTLGIFCLDNDNRDLADVNDIKIDATGGFQAAYTWEAQDSSRNEIVFQCQTGGPGLYQGVTVKSCRTQDFVVDPPDAFHHPGTKPGGGSGLPATGLPGLLGVAAAVALAASLVVRRRVTR